MQRIPVKTSISISVLFCYFAGVDFSVLYLQVLAMSSRSWLSYSYQSRFHLTPLSYETLEYASSFSSEQCPEGIVAISANTLRWAGDKIVCRKTRG